MRSISQFYLQGQPSALDGWNGGEGQRAHRKGSCRGKVGVMVDEMAGLSESDKSSHRLVQSVLKHGGAWDWSGKGPVRFESSGALSSPWGAGSWGSVPSPWRKDSLHIKLDGEAYLLMFLSEKWAFVALRCSDEQVTFGRGQGASVPQGRLVFCLE